MKKITVLGAFLLSLTQFSCKEDYLVATDPTRIGTDLFYKNETQFLQALSGVYGQLQTITNSAYIFQEFPSDNTTLDFNPLDRGEPPAGKPLNSRRSIRAMVKLPTCGTCITQPCITPIIRWKS
ncbi:hypothetical protein [Spirosoma sp. KNUC1025]|uniref:hypothetical protein n=1 Tax=Spirosoma sp. KNUC1025 TaxID=2894082 RepID=UPI00386F8DBC|nr:hypothetical protein LN737_13200 [Spirosoma sp. KNUC1025]